jgi:hypothetical protein
MGLVPRGMDSLSDIHLLATDLDRVEDAGRSNNLETWAPGGHHAQFPF